MCNLYSSLFEIVQAMRLNNSSMLSKNHSQNLRSMKRTIPHLQVHILINFLKVISPPSTQTILDIFSPTLSFFSDNLVLSYFYPEQTKLETSRPGFRQEI